MTGKQPDQLICEIFFLCLDLIIIIIKKASRVRIFFTAYENAPGRYGKYLRSALGHARGPLGGQRRVGAVVAAAVSPVLPAQHATALPRPASREKGNAGIGSAPSALSPGAAVRKHVGTYPEPPRLTPEILPAEHRALCTASRTAGQAGALQTVRVRRLVAVSSVKTRGNQQFKQQRGDS